MIAFTNFNEPLGWKSEELIRYNERLKSFYELSAEERLHRKLPKFSFSNLPPNIRRTINSKTNSKCAYCEVKLHENNSQISHFRPTSSSAQLNGKTSKDHYWWLATEWSNLIPVCFECNTFKRNLFPTANRRTTIQYSDKKELFKTEKPIIVDPEIENPEEHFYYEISGNYLGQIQPYNSRAKHTINILGLNRKNLLEARRVVIDQYKTLIDQLLGPKQNEESRIKDLLNWFRNTNDEYLGLKRYLIKEALKSQEIDINQYLDDDLIKTLNVKPRYYQRHEEYDEHTQEENYAIFIESISIQNYKAINDITIQFNKTTEGKAGWAILIGENGVGKSSTLQATLKLLVGRSFRGYKFNESDIKRGEEKASINIELERTSEQYQASALITKKEAQVRSSVKYKFPKGAFIDSCVLGYGPFKHSNRKDSRAKEFKAGSHIHNFIDSSIPLNNPILFLLRLNTNQFNEVSIAILDLFLLEEQATIHRNINKGQVWLRYRNNDNIKDLDELSDGYQSVLTLGCNIMEGLLRNNENMESASGLVVIDELGANLHPRWKMQIVKRLRRTFPNVQFLVTTHDPLCLKGIEKGETYVLRELNGETTVLNNLPNPSHLRADQLLTSEFFGLHSTQDPETERLFINYYELLRKANTEKRKDHDLQIQLLKNELRERNHLGSSLREEMLYEVIDTIIAKRRNDREFRRDKIDVEVKIEAIKLIDTLLKDL